MGAYSTMLAFWLGQLLDSFARPRALGNVAVEMLFVLDPVRDIRRRPDVAFVSAQKWPLDRPIPESGDWDVVPDLAVEVISPNDVFQKVVAKLDEYFHFGVQQVWIVVPSSRKVHVYDSPTQARILTAADELDGGTLLPGFRLPVGSLFQRQPEAGPAI